MEIKNIVALVAIGVIVSITVAYMVVNQKAKIMEWLKYAVIEAEKYLGGGTGQLKLRQVYDWFISQFPILSAFVPFGVFASWVDVALETMETWLDGNKKVKAYVEGADYEGDTEELA